MRLRGASLCTSLFALAWLACLICPVNSMKVTDAPSWSDSKLDDQNKDNTWTNVQEIGAPKSDPSTPVSSLAFHDRPRSRAGFRRALVANKRGVSGHQLSPPFSGSAEGVAKSTSDFRNYPAENEFMGRDWEKRLVDEQTEEPPSKRSGEKSVDEEFKEKAAGFDVLGPALAVRNATGDKSKSNEVIRKNYLLGQLLKEEVTKINAEEKAANEERKTRSTASLEGPTTSSDAEGSSTSSVTRGSRDRRKKKQGSKGKDKFK
ncbi:hypothetical protein FA10DRAFT_262385 [Acaromyces ingoldii]|uniref:Uncharacterized protein n=1 Tax=Acaromyces ingoldii TaxID=215250 RepID=A0A316YH68_9BASI|nr:hypothetical protein FA10DRAFT_262385 [Acaromyces ingoldii]PWN87958.1 hypothetical protein FA10DRAFT_262385 [Acaromyces ingoldii]